MLECLATSRREALEMERALSRVCLDVVCACVCVRECDRPERPRNGIFQTKIRVTARMLEVEELIAFSHPQG